MKFDAAFDAINDLRHMLVSMKEEYDRECADREKENKADEAFTVWRGSRPDGDPLRVRVVGDGYIVEVFVPGDVGEKWVKSPDLQDRQWAITQALKELTWMDDE